jgi:predicted transposase/invertase (TIGR01784 family)
LGKEDLGYIEVILCYIMEKADSEKAEEVIEVFKESLSEEARGKIMTIAERLIEKGKLEGIHEGMMKGKLEVAKNMLAMGQSIQLITRITGLSEEELNRLNN